MSHPASKPAFGEYIGETSGSDHPLHLRRASFSVRRRSSSHAERSTDGGAPNTRQPTRRGESMIEL